MDLLNSNWIEWEYLRLEMHSYLLTKPLLKNITLQRKFLKYNQKKPKMILFTNNQYNKKKELKVIKNKKNKKMNLKIKKL